MENIDGVCHTLISLMIREEHGIQFHEIHTKKLCDFLKTFIYSQIV